jgi:IclR helix-turn-helix domain
MDRRYEPRAQQVKQSSPSPPFARSEAHRGGKASGASCGTDKAPGSLDELARITGKAKSNLSRTLRTMEGYGLVRLERGERGRITPKVTHDPSQAARQ